MTKQEHKNTTASFKLIKQLITKCDLDPYYKGLLLSAINKVIRMKDVHFRIDTPITNISRLFNWNAAKILKKGDNYNFWLTMACYIDEVSNPEYTTENSLFKKQLINILDNSKL